MGHGSESTIVRAHPAYPPGGLIGVRLSRVAVTAAWTMSPFVVLALVWLLISELEVFPKLWLPGPEDVVKAGLRQLQSGVLVSDIAISAARLFGGFAIGAILGMTTGIAMGTNRLASLYVDPIVSFFQSIGGIAWVPLAVLWFGFGWGSVLFVIANTVFFIVLFNTVSGVEAVPQNLVNSARTLGANWRTVVFEILIPGALPSIVNGMRQAMSLGWRALIAAEMIAASSGLGFRIFNAAAFWKSDEIVFGLIVIGTLWSITDNLVLRPLEARTVERWQTVRSNG